MRALRRSAGVVAVVACTAMALLLSTPVSARHTESVIPVALATASASPILEEGFTSWGTLDPGWTVSNRSFNGFQSYFDIRDSVLYASNNGVMAYDNYFSYANWTSAVSFSGVLTISFDLYLPLSYDQKDGWAGQAFWFVLYDEMGREAIATRWVMDLPGDTWPVGWVYYADGYAAQICPFAAGWHTISVKVGSGAGTWTAGFDGAEYPGLLFSDGVQSLSEVSKLQFMNALREEAQVVAVDALVILETTSEPPPDAETMTVTVTRKQGRPSMSAVSWAVTPERECVLEGSIGNDGLAWLRLTITESGPSGEKSLFAGMIHLQGQGTHHVGTVELPSMTLTWGSTYSFTAQPVGGVSTSATLTLTWA